MHMSVKTDGIAPNSARLLWAGFMAILAAGVGFALRGGIFDNWGHDFGFSATTLGVIGGAGFTGFCFGIIIGGLVVDKIGYGKLVLLAFTLHIVSAFVTFGASTPANAEQFLFWGMFLFAYANGTLEAVANPLVATLYPKNRTHYLNILHASWPAGMVLGAIAGWFLDDKFKIGWKIQLALYLVPTLIYGIMFMGQKFPKSEASQKGAKLGEMSKDIGLIGAAVVGYMVMLFASQSLHVPAGIAWAIGGAIVIAVGFLTKFSFGSLLLFVFFVAHILVGAVELGTDGWIQNITGNLFTSEQGKFLFIWTSAIMFCLRFTANFIERNLKLSPVGILFLSSVFAVVGLRFASSMETFAMAVIALGIYAIGKTFFWPTMLAVVSDQFPRSGAVAISVMGGLGFFSAGLLGGPGLGYSKDRFAAEELQRTNMAVYEQVKSEKASEFIFFKGVNAISGTAMEEARGSTERTLEQQALVDASEAGDRKTLKVDSYVPLTMAGIYLLLLLYFRSKGGYRPKDLASSGHH
jgi:MFS family permease